MNLPIKKLLPPKFILYVNRTRQRIAISRLYRFDQKRLKKYAFTLQKQFSRENLRAKITLHYHAIEKGLSNANPRLGFGERAFTELFWTMDAYIKNGYPTDDSRFQSAVSVIAAYVKLHQTHNHSVPRVEENLKKYISLLLPENRELGGFLTLKRDELPDFRTLAFDDLSKNRVSVRDFGEDQIDDPKVFEALRIATRTPSVCNRQAWRVRYVKSPEKVQDVLKIQGGFRGNGENLRSLLIVTADKQYMTGGRERNQTYIDGGMFAMSLLYALTSVGIASCPLNASFRLEQEEKIRHLLQVGEAEDFITVIALGTYPAAFKIAKSPRDDYQLFTTVIE